MQNPYQTLGVDRNASSDEIKKAYRKLSRIYHPDANVNNPDKNQAETKFKEVQEAYNQIMKEREQGDAGYGGYGNSGYGGQAFYGERDESIDFQAIRNYLNAGHYKEALHILQGQAERSARWFYYSAIANAGVGNNILALEHARKAQVMEPTNMEYRMLVSRMESGGQWYQTMGRDYGYPAANMGNCCWQMLCMNIACNCCLRPI